MRATPFGRRRGGECGGEPGQDPTLVHQEPQAERGEHDQHRLGIGVRQDERAREHREQDHRPLGHVDAEEATGQDADQHHGAERQHEVEHERGDRVAARQHDVERPNDRRVQREERGPRLELEVGDVRRDRSRVAVADDLQVPEAVPLGEDPGDETHRRAGARLECDVGVDGHLAGSHAGPGEDAQARHDEGTDPDDQGLVPGALVERRGGDVGHLLTVRGGVGRVGSIDGRGAVGARPDGVGRSPDHRATSFARSAHHRYIGRIRRRGPNFGAGRPAHPMSRWTRPR